jgi:hypothetical protein
VLGVDVQNLLPGFPSIRGHEDAALFVRSGIVPEGGHVHDVCVERIDDDARDVARVRESQVPPGLASIERLVDAVAERNTVARVRLAGANPHHVRIVGVDGDVADRNRGLVIEDRRPGHASVDRLEQAARGRRDVNQRRIAGNPLDVGDAAAHRCRSDAAPFETLEE